MNKDYRIGLLIKEHGTATNALKFLLYSEETEFADNDYFADYLIGLEEKHIEFLRANYPDEGFDDPMYDEE